MSSGDDERVLLDDDLGDVEDEGLSKRRGKHRVVCGVKCDGFMLIVAGMSAFTIVVTIALVVNILVQKKSSSATEVVVAVSTDSPTCTDIGMTLLRKNATPAEAAIGALFCLGVVHPHSSGIGGGGFMLVKNLTGAEVIDYRETAPQASTANMYHGDELLMLLGGLAVGVPGEPRGLVLAYRRHGGQLPWKDLVMPSVALARDGFPAEETLIHALNVSLPFLKTMENYDAFAKDFLPNGTLPRVNQTLRRPELADTLKVLSDFDAVDTFYTGKIADSIVEAVTNTGGIMTHNDLKNYQAKIHTPTEVTLTMEGVSGWKIFGAPPPASGAVLSLIANIIDGYKSLDDSVLSYHRVVEAFKFAYARRTYLADPGFHFSQNVSKIAEEMQDHDYANMLRAKINDSRTFNVSYYGAHYDVRETPGTTHLCILRGSEAVSVTSTVNTYFGAMVLPSTGFILNNEMNDFSAPNITNAFDVPPSEVNFVEPNKRPLSSMSPTIVVDNKNEVRAVLGASGGTRITTVTFQVLANLLLKGKDVKQSIMEPRIHHQLRPDYVWAESDFSADIQNGLRGKGHIVNGTYSFLAVCQAIHRTSNGTVMAQADVKRKGGAGRVETINV